MPDAKLSQLSDFVGRKCSANRIVRVAQQEQFRPLGDFRLEVLEIKSPLIAIQYQRASD